jgi:hypothetical protein
MILTMAVLAAQITHGDPAMTRASLFGPMACRVEAAPQINVAVRSDDIHYDYSKSAAELKALENNKASSPYPPGADTATGGLRADHPTVATSVTLDIVSNLWSKQGCARYKSIDIEIHLRPQIYVAKEYDTGVCRQAVLAHELKHVQVDRDVMNKYAAIIAPQVQDIVNRIGALGPFGAESTEAVKAQAAGYVTVATDRIEKAMETELNTRQKDVDSLEEYRYVGSFCQDVHLLLPAPVGGVGR